MELPAKKYGLTLRDLATLHAIFKSFPEVQQVNIFGSRAKGVYKPGSDIDLAIMNDGVSNQIVRSLQSAFAESSLPYKVDIVNFFSLTSDEFIAHIKRVGVPIYLQE